MTNESKEEKAESNIPNKTEISDKTEKTESLQIGITKNANSTNSIEDSETTPSHVDSEMNEGNGEKESLHTESIMIEQIIAASEKHYNDVPSSHEFAPDIYLLTLKNILQGRTNDHF